MRRVSYALQRCLKLLLQFVSLRNHTKLCLVVFCIIFLSGALMMIRPASAQVVDTNGIMNGLLSAMSWMMLGLAKICISMTIFFLKFFIELARYNGYIEAPPVIIGWIMVRDIANMFFVVVLLVIAFGTILGIEQYEWKKTLVKLIFAAIFINFSKLIAQLMIDVAHVFTMTFLNAVSATAGGNLINMFNLNSMMSMLSQDPAVGASANIRLDIFIASVMAMFFALLAMATLATYVVVMLIRVVVLWTLIILAPLAYLLNAVPNTQSYAREYWEEFTRHIIVAPVMVFFLWLAFATLGNGNIASQINLNLSGQGDAQTVITATAANPSASILQITTWENMANFFIAIAFLMIGIERVQKLGVRGGGLVSSAVSFAKNVATIASGYAAGRWLVSGAGKVIGATAGGIVKHAPLVGSEALKDRFGTEWQAIRARWWGRAGGLDIDYADQAFRRKDEEYQLKKQELQQKELKGENIDEADTKALASLEQERNILKAKKEELEKGAGGILGSIARSSIQRKRRYEKGKKLADQRFEIAWKRAESDTGGYVFGVGGALSKMGLGEKAVPDQDRFEKGILEVEDTRGDKKTAEMSAEGKRNTLERLRIKNGKAQGDKGTMAAQMAGHEEQAAKFEEQIRQTQSRERRIYQEGKGKQALDARLKAQLEVKAEEAESHKMEELARTRMIQRSIEELPEKEEERRKKLEAQVASGKITEEQMEEMLHEPVKDVLARTIAAEKQAHTEQMKVEQLTKEKERKYFEEDHHGQEELALEARLKAQMAADESEVKELETRAVRNFFLAAENSEAKKLLFRRKQAELGTQAEQGEISEMEEEQQLRSMQEGSRPRGPFTRIQATEFRRQSLQAQLKQFSAEGKLAALYDQKTGEVTDLGKTLIAEINRAEQGTAAAEAFAANIKDHDLELAFEQVTKRIKAAAERGPEALEELARRDAYVRALKNAKVGAARKESMAILKSEAESEAEAEYVEKRITGYTTPSSSLVPVAKRYSDALNSLTTSALAKALTDNLAFVAEQVEKEKKTGGKSLRNIQMRAALFGTINKVNSEAYVDDTLGQIAEQINRLEKGELTGEDAKKAELLKDVWVNKLKVIKGKSGNRVGISNARNASILQNYAITGGNLDLMDKHLKVEEYMKQEKKKGNKISYKKAAVDVLGKDTDSFMKEMAENDNFLKEAASSFKAQALAAGHKQLGGHQLFDSELGFHRMATEAEAKGTMQAEMRKRGSKVGYQYQSLGNVNTDTGILEKVDAQDYGDTIGQINKYLDMKGIQDRTRDALMGYEPSKDKEMVEGFGLLGGKMSDIIKNFGSQENFLRDVILPQLAKGPKAFALVAQKKFDNVSTTEAEAGKLKVAIDGTSIKADNLVDLIDQITTQLEGNLGEFADDIKEARQAAEATLKKPPKEKKTKGKSEERTEGEKEEEVEDEEAPGSA